MKRPRCTLRVSMIAVAVVALMSWGYALWRRSADFDAKARQFESRLLPKISRLGGLGLKEYAYIAGENEYSASELAQLMSILPGIEYYKQHSEYLLRLREYKNSMARKYRRAARRPWMPVDPDPPPPAAPIRPGRQIPTGLRPADRSA
jgi:hypothetical protein